MNNKGQYAIYTLMIGIVVLILALAFAPALKSFVDTARLPSTNESIGLDCTNNSISDFDKATCVTTDLYLPYFILGLVGLALIIIGAKVVGE